MDHQKIKRILVETGADMEWLPELRDEKIDDILGMVSRKEKEK